MAGGGLREGVVLEQLAAARGGRSSPAGDAAQARHVVCCQSWMTAPDTDTPLQESIGATELLHEPPQAEPLDVEDLDLHDVSLYFGRELSWLDFNDRVLQLAADPEQPLLERVKLAAIWSSNLDEFFQIRVAGVHDQIDAGLVDPGPDGLTPSQTIDAIRERVLDQQQRLETLVARGAVPGARRARHPRRRRRRRLRRATARRSPSASSARSSPR